MLRLYLDEDVMSDALLRALRAEGIDVISAADAGKRGLDDERQLAFATEEGRVLYTANVRDFGRLHAAWLAEGRRHGGIIAVPRQRIPVGEQARCF